MKARLFISILFLVTSGCQAVAPAPTAVPPTVTRLPPSPKAVDTPVPSAPTDAATEVSEPGVPVATLKVVSSLPMSGYSAATGEAISNAMKLRLAQANGHACSGEYKIEYEAWDDISTTTALWDADVEAANVHKAVDDKSIIAYLGTYNSGAAKAAIPILDKAGPLVMISPANTYPGLTKPVLGNPSEPSVYYPARVRNYVRVVTADDVQGAVDARYMFNELGVKSVFILDDQEPYGMNIAAAFQSSAKSLGMTVAGHKAINPKSTDFKDLMKLISTSNSGAAPDAIFAATIYEESAAELLTDKVTFLGDNQKVRFMVPEAIEAQSFVDRVGATFAEGVYASAGGRAFPDHLTDAGNQFVKDYESAYGALVEPYAIYGYESMSVLLQALENTCIVRGDPTDRKRVRDMVFSIRNFDGVLGTWSFDKNGDTSLSDMTIYVVKNGAFKFVAIYQ